MHQFGTYLVKINLVVQDIVWVYSHSAYSHFAYAHFAYDLSHFAYSHFTTHILPTLKYIISSFAYSFFL